MLHYRGFLGKFAHEHIAARFDIRKYSMLGEIAVEPVSIKLLRDAIAENEDAATLNSLWEVVDAVQTVRVT